jgi:hypothetical protein
MSELVFAVLIGLLEQCGLLRVGFGVCAFRRCAAAVCLAVCVDDGDKRRDGGAIETTRAQQMREAVALVDKEACKWVR